ncbi:hypothetical protein BaRGS_00023101 [Batillaria attramentaria]|uniref:Uncharacterized protein n=1 Tax=Batillaria attramentaria TaxID=370345 RepID=A0ABD0KF21_9CAEN
MYTFQQLVYKLCDNLVRGEPLTANTDGFDIAQGMRFILSGCRHCCFYMSPPVVPVPVLRVLEVRRLKSAKQFSALNPVRIRSRYRPTRGSSFSKTSSLLSGNLDILCKPAERRAVRLTVNTFTLLLFGSARVME